MSVTNLTNTTWKLTANEWTATAGYGLFNVNCTLKQIHGGTFEWTDCTKFGVGYKVGSAHNFTTESNRVCVDVHYMTVQNYANVEVSFFGGTDVTNTKLISWLETYGELQKVTDLTGSTWVIPSGWTADAEYGKFDINGSLYINGSLGVINDKFEIGYKIKSGTTTTGSANCLVNGGSWYDNTYEFEFIFRDGGVDVTNTLLIDWLYTNGYMTVLPTTEEPEQPTTPTKKFTRLYLGATAITSNGKRFRKLQDTEVEPSEPITLAAGLYDVDDDLVASWDTLVNTYGMNCSKDYTTSTCRTDASSPYCVLKKGALSSGVKLVIDGSITEIGKHSFSFCEQLTNIILLEGVKTLDEYCFYYSSAKEIILPNTIKSIGASAFYYAENLTSLNIPNDVTNISQNLCSGCSSLTKVVIPSTVKNIRQQAFAWCSALYNFTFTGTVEEWRAITFGQLWNQNVPAIQVLCSNGTVTL